jgi:N-acetylneuraminate epimerase
MHSHANSNPMKRLKIEQWPALPLGFKNGIGVQVDDVGYIGLGSVGTDVYAIDLKAPIDGWKRKALFIGPPTFGAAAAASGGNIYIFGGNGLASPQAKSATIFDTVYQYDCDRDYWTKLNTATPVGLSGAKAMPLSDGRIALFGGYNKQLFDDFLASLVGLDASSTAKVELFSQYMSMQPADYKWNQEVFCYDPNTNQWSSLGLNPHLPNCDAAAIAAKPDCITLIGGEIKPGLRTPSVKRATISNNLCTWERLSDMPPIKGQTVQEGVAGAYSAALSDSILLAGGVNFQGARDNFAAGNLYAHRGLQKTWRQEVYLFRDDEWQEIGNLPIGIGYGVSFCFNNHLIIVGGEDNNENARDEVFAIKIA